MMSDLPVFDLTSEALDIGDTVKFVAKMNALFTKLQTWANAVDAAMGSTDLITQLQGNVTALQTADQAEINVRQQAVQSLQSAINALTTQLAELGTSGVSELNTKLTTLNQVDARETANRLAADTNLQAALTELDARMDAFVSISGVSLSDLQTTADSIAQLVASANGLTVESIAGLQNELDEVASTAIVQIHEDAGVLTDLSKNKWGTSFPSGAVFNGLSLGLRPSQMDLVETYKYQSNSVSNGGSSSFEIAPEIQSLHDAMGLSQSGGRRHRPWFYLAKYKVKSVLTAFPTGARAGFHLLSQSGFPAGPGNWLATAYWIRNDTPELLMIYNAYRIWFNGVQVAGYSLVPEGWTHVAILHNSATGYVNSVAGLYGKASAEFIMGQPVISRSKVKLPIHTNPVATI